jgi:hypothetical protein
MAFLSGEKLQRTNSHKYQMSHCRFRNSGIGDADQKICEWMENHQPSAVGTHAASSEVLQRAPYNPTISLATLCIAVYSVAVTIQTFLSSVL